MDSDTSHIWWRGKNVTVKGVYDENTKCTSGNHRVNSNNDGIDITHSVNLSQVVFISIHSPQVTLLRYGRC